MRVARLHVERSTDDRRQLRLEVDGRVLAEQGGRDEPADLEVGRFTRALKGLEGTASAPGSRQLESFVRAKAERLVRSLPGRLVSRLADWAGQDPEPPTLVAVGGGGPPWELLTAPYPSLFVVRMPPAAAVPAAAAPAAPARPSLLAAGWPAVLGAPLPGIRRELDELGKRASPAGLAVTTSTHATFAELADAIAREQPTVVHLSPPVMDDRGGGKLPMGADPATVEWVEVSALVDALRQARPLQLVTLNVCYGGVRACGAISEALGVAAIGWAGGVDDRIASELALSLYDGLLMGRSAPEAVRGFCRQFGEDQMLARGMPVVWVARDDQLVRSPLAAAAPAVRAFGRGDEAGLKGLTAPAPAPAPRRLEGPPRIGIELALQGTLFPSLVRNGVPAVKALTLEADRGVEAEVEVECDTGAGSSTYRTTVAFEKRLPLLEMSKVQFPVLYELMDGEDRRYVSFSVAVRQDGRVLARKTESVLWRGRSEWLDSREAWPYLASFVVPMCDGVLQVVEESRRVLRAIAGPKAVFGGYDGGAEGTDRQVDAVFQALRDPPLAIRYIAPPGSPLFSSVAASGGDRREPRQIGQLVRLPDAVVREKQGTCHDLSLLVAAVLEYLNLRPLLVLVEGHTFCGYWRTAEAHDAFWAAALEDPSRLHEGANRVLTRAELDDLRARELVRLVEATRISAPDTFAEACGMGERTFADTTDCGLEGLRRWDAAVDVAASRRHLVEPV